MPNVLVEADQTMWTLSPTARRSASRCRRFRLRAWQNLSRCTWNSTPARLTPFWKGSSSSAARCCLRGQMLPPLKGTNGLFLSPPVDEAHTMRRPLAPCVDRRWTGTHTVRSGGLSMNSANLKDEPAAAAAASVSPYASSSVAEVIPECRYSSSWTRAHWHCL
jgi:hypothetical protein